MTDAPNISAFPVSPDQTRGMSLRDYFAAAALPLVIGVNIPEWQLKGWFGGRGGLTREEIAAHAAYEYADAMLTARAKASEKESA